MTLAQLRVFVAVARHEHMTRAADSLNLAQSAASAAITALETEYGVRLFDRVGRNIRLSVTGQGFLPHACALLEQAEQVSATLRDTHRKTRLDAPEAG